MKHLVLFSILLLGGVFVQADDPKLPSIVIDEAEKNSFPAQPKAPDSYKLLSEGKKSHSSTLEKTESKVREIYAYEKLPDNKLKATFEVEQISGILIKDKKTIPYEGEKVFKNLKLSMVIDCEKKSVSQKLGFDEAIKRIEKTVKSSETQDRLIGYLSQSVEKAPENCKKNLGPFNPNQFVGKKPGTTWVEPVPIPGFEGAKLNAKFLGWSKIDKTLFAVLEGKAIAKAENSPSPGVTSEFEIHSFTLVSQDWKITKTLLLTKIAITSKSEGNFSGTTLLEHTATRLD